MAENESLDLGGAYAKRWDVPLDSVRKGAPCNEVARKVETALHSGLRKSLIQWQENGVSLRKAKSNSACRSSARRKVES